MKQEGKGFTLVELLICILIIAVLAGIAIPKYQYSAVKSRFTQLKVAAKAIYESQRRYMLENNKQISLDLSALDVSIEGCSYNTKMDKINCDWGYCTFSSGRAYIFCHLDNPYIRYFIDFQTGWKICCASKSSGNLGKKICQAEFPNSEGVESRSCGTGGINYTGY